MLHYRGKVYAFGGGVQKGGVGSTNADLYQYKKWSALPNLPVPLRFATGAVFCKRLYTTCFDDNRLIEFNPTTKSYCVVDSRSLDIHYKYFFHTKSKLFVHSNFNTLVFNSQMNLIQTHESRIQLGVIDTRGTFAIDRRFPKVFYMASREGRIWKFDARTMNSSLVQELGSSNSYQ